MGLIDDLDQLISGSQQVRRTPAQGREAEGNSKPNKVTLQSQRKSSSSEGRYEAWPMAQLQDEVRRYGFRPTQTRQNLLAQLYQVKEALEKQQQQQQQEQPDSEIGDVSIASTSSSFLHYSSMDLTSDGESVGDFSMNVIRQARDGSKDSTRREQQPQQQRQDQITRARVRDSIADRDGDDDDDDDHHHDSVDYDEDEDDLNVSPSQIDSIDAVAEEANSSSPNDIEVSLSNQLYKAITMDKALYHRILLFEPVSFDEVSSTAKRAGVTGLRSKEVLRNWLDMQGICFYSAELTGQRQRY